MNTTDITTEKVLSRYNTNYENHLRIKCSAFLGNL